jgi:hypothetical protein
LVSGKLAEIPKPKLQIPGKLQTPNFKWAMRNSCLGFEDWDLIGAWMLGFGA